MPDVHKNFAVSLVATAPSPAASGTSLVVTAGHGTRFPAVPFNAVIHPVADLPDPSNAEVVRVTAIATDTLTITRAQESSSARTVVVGDRIYAAVTAKSFTDIEGTHKFIAKGGDTARNTTTTPTADPDLLFAIGANEIWVWDMYIIAHDASGGTADLRVRMDAPSGAAGKWGMNPQYNISQAVVTPDSTAYGSEVAGIGLTSADRWKHLQGICRNGGTPGNVTLLWAQNVSNGSNVTLRTDSFLLAHRVG